MKKTKYWRRIGDFTFSPEVKVYILIDSLVQSIETIFKRITFTNVNPSYSEEETKVKIANKIINRNSEMQSSIFKTKVYSERRYPQILYILPFV